MLDVQTVYHSRTAIPFNAKTPHVLLIKPHGSSNFTLNTKQFGSTFGNIQCVGPNRASLQIGHIEPVKTHQEIVRWCKDPNHQSFCPAISLYEKEKRSITNNNQILEMQTQFASIIKKARRIFLIGTALATQDTHIWDPIRKSKCELIVIDINPDPITYWAKLHKKYSTKALKGSFIELIDDIAKEMVMHNT
ncbi:MAG: hypothetical protein EOP48_07160 [Sphingobacteriales bacterium]|nr:MAG: hypothetical protein EOP48_07160 [Sphingobacteriales bacterium]